MNKRDWIVLAVLVNHGYKNHRTLIQHTGYSIGLINAALRQLIELNYIDQDYNITDKTRAYLEDSRPRRAIILAAGLGLRMIPVSNVPKGLLKINGQPLIERVIKQLHDVDIREIYVVGGYRIEKLEYLTDKFGVKLIYDNEYDRRDSLHSLYLAADYLSNSYVVPCNVWFSRNPFNDYEYFSWYAVSEYIDDESYVRLNRKMELVFHDDESGGNSMIGLAYLRKEAASAVRRHLSEMYRMRRYAKETWERALFSGNKMLAYARIMLGQTAYAINTYEDLRELDSESQDLRSKHMKLICNVFNITTDEITDISNVFKGMTNRLMRFCVNKKPYMLRIPGVGSNELTSRRHEADVYNALDGRGITEMVVYISPDDGYKIAEYLENSRNCDFNDEKDVAACMRHLKKLHDMKLEVSHSFDIRAMLSKYETLIGFEPSFVDYAETREKTIELLSLIDDLSKERCLCHIDAVSDNFLFIGDDTYLIDWEYAGMCDPHIDVAMFCLYANYDKDSFDRALNLYYGEQASDIDRLISYSYAAAGGLLWSVWCEYKSKFGVNYAEYSINQYRYARNFYVHAMKLAAKMSDTVKLNGAADNERSTVK